MLCSIATLITSHIHGLLRKCSAGLSSRQLCISSLDEPIGSESKGAIPPTFIVGDLIEPCEHKCVMKSSNGPSPVEDSGKGLL